MIDPNVLRRLSEVHVRRWLWAAAWNWATIIGAIWVFEVWSYWWTYLPALFVIGTRQHALGVLVHEGVHYRVSPSRFWNDFLSDYLAGYYLLTPTAGYRAFHLKHHQLLDTPEDPERITLDRFPKEWSFPMSAGRFLLYLLRDLIGVWPKPMLVLFTVIWSFLGPERRTHLLRIGALLGFLVIGAGVTGHLVTYVILWWVPLMTVFPMCFRMRTVAEHSGLESGARRYTRSKVDVLDTTRTVISTVPGRLVFGPHNVGLHVEHHLYPSVPFYRLPDLRQVLRADAEFSALCHTSPGYHQTIRELVDVSPDRNQP
jgi:fatty acid desaturase